MKSQVADVTLAEERILKEREERTGKGGGILEDQWQGRR